MNFEPETDRSFKQTNHKLHTVSVKHISDKPNMESHYFPAGPTLPSKSQKQAPFGH